MKHTKYENITDVDLDDIIKWLQAQFGENTPLSVGLNLDGTIRQMDIGKSLTKADKKIITDKYSELVGKEIG